jgi:hypothetical protein
MNELSTQALTPDRTTRFIAEITREIKRARTEGKPG